MKHFFLALLLPALACGQHVKQISPNGGGSLSDVLVTAPDNEAQLGLAYYGNKVFHVLGSGSTATGDWRHSFAFPTGIESIGDPDFSGPGATRLSLQLNGNMANWDTAGDSVVTALNWSTNESSSGSGFNVAVMRPGFGVASVAVASGGSGYAVGDLLSVTGGSLAGPNAAVRVDTVDSGAITSALLYASGEYLTAPSNPVSVANITGGGTGATLTLTFTPKSVHANADNSLSFMHVPINRLTGLIPGWGMIVANRDETHNRGLAFCAPGLAGFDTGNYSLLQLDWGNRKFRIPRWVASAYQPSDAGWQDTLIADPATGVVTIPGTLAGPTITGLAAQIAALEARLDALLLRLKAAGTEP